MQEEIQGKNFVKKFVFSSIIILIIMMLIMYIVDPFLYYRETDNLYWLDSMFVSSGLIKNHNYDTAIIGSSMFQNFKMDWFREKLGYQPVNLTLGGMDVEETEMLMENVVREGKATRMVVCFDLISFNIETSKGRYPTYIYDDNKWNDFKYLLGYEAWTKFLPLDIAFNVLYQLFPNQMQEYVSYTDKDVLGNRVEKQKFGADIVKEGYLDETKTVSKQNTEGMRDRLSNRLDVFIQNCDFEQNSDIEYIFVMPPYSALYWYNAQQEGYYDILMDSKKEVVNKLSKYNNVRIIDMHAIDGIADLNHYKDITHYDMILQEQIVDRIKDETNDLNMENIEESIQKLNSILEQFKEENQDWLK